MFSKAPAHGLYTIKMYFLKSVGTYSIHSNQFCIEAVAYQTHAGDWFEAGWKFDISTSRAITEFHNCIYIQSMVLML